MYEHSMQNKNNVSRLINVWLSFLAICKTKQIFTLILLIYGLTETYCQDRILTGTWLTYSPCNSPIINIYADSTFSYYSPIDVGNTPETKGFYRIKNDSIFFDYKNQIHPKIDIVASKQGSNAKLIKITFNTNITDSFQLVSLHVYLNKIQSDRYKSLGFVDKKGILYIDKFQQDDTLYIHPDMYSRIMCNLDIRNFNTFKINLLLPDLPTTYYLDSNFGVFKNDLLYVDFDGNSIPFYNLTIYDTKRKREKINNLIYRKIKINNSQAAYK